MIHRGSRLVLACSAFLAVSVLVGCAGPEESSSDQAEQQTETQRADKQGQTDSNETSSASGEEVLYRVNAGATESYETEDGTTWKADKSRWKGEGNWGAEGGKAVNRGNIEIRNTNHDNIYRHERWGMPGYSFEVPNGTYKLRLHFAETYHGVESQGTRLFSVNVEGKRVIEDFDVFRAAGGRRQTAVVRTIENVDVSDGELNITFDFQSLTPLINGIEVIKSS